LMKKATKRNKHYQHHQSYNDFLTAKHPDRILSALSQLNYLYLTDPIGGQT
jgi:hypothetical protein